MLSIFFILELLGKLSAASPRQLLPRGPCLGKYPSAKSGDNLDKAGNSGFLGAQCIYAI